MRLKELTRGWDMNCNLKKMWPIATLSLMSITALLQADNRFGFLLGNSQKTPKKTEQECKTVAPVKKKAGEGPDRVINPSTNPRVTEADVNIFLAAFLWNAHEDGLEFVIDNEVSPSQFQGNLVDADYKNPHFKWNWGFKVGAGYAMNRDGWDVDLLWTHFHTHAKKNVQADSNSTLLPLWSGFASTAGGALTATNANADWKLHLDLLDLELGREFWTSRWLTLRPFIGLRGVRIHQKYDIEHMGGSFGVAPNFFTNKVHLKDYFKGVGIRAGLNTDWEFGCGFSAYGNFAVSIIYGRFNVKDKENNHEVQSPFSTIQVVDTEDHFRASKAITDLALGLQWRDNFWKDRLGLTVAFGWENHIFFNQNQFFSVNRVGSTASGTLPNNSGQNVFEQRKGDLSTQGWTLSVQFDF